MTFLHDTLIICTLLFKLTEMQNLSQFYANILRNMSKIYIIHSILCCSIWMVSCDSIIGPGKWKMLKIDKKKGDFDKFEFNIVQRKFNRTHDVFQGSMDFHDDLNEKYGVKLDVCLHVDGGCKQFLVINENSFEGLIDKYAGQNFKDMLQLAGVMDPRFPVKMGKYEFEQYLWNWDSLPQEGPWGRYNSDCCVMELNQEVGCLSIEILFEELEDDEE